MTSDRRRRAVVALVVATALLLAGAAVAWYAKSTLADEREFSARAAAALDDPNVRALLADRMVDALSKGAVPDALSVRPLLVPALATVADSRPFRRLFTRVVADRHRALIDGETTFTFELPVGEGLVYEAIGRFAPRAADAIPSGLRVPVLRLNPTESELAGGRFLDDLAGWRWPLLLAGLFAATGAALLSGGARRGLVSLGVAAAGAGLLVAALVAGLGELVVAHAASAADLSDSGERGAVRAVWMALFSDLLTAGLVAALGGAVVAALASRGMPALRPAAAREWATRALSSSAPAARVARATVLIAVGAALIFEPVLLAQVLLVLTGVAIVLAGASQLAAGQADARRPQEKAPEPGGASPLLLAGAVAATLIAAVVVVALILPGPRAATLEVAGSAKGCNGSPALCNRRLDEVVFASTHNSYAAASEPGWLFANQRYGIARQLRDGIRGFLIDIHFGAPDPESDRILTDFEAEGSSRNKVVKALGPEGLRAADALVGRSDVGRPEGESRPYLCHTLCEIGAEPLDQELEQVGAFMDANPREVIILFIEPYVPVEEIESALDETGLLEQAAELRANEPLPTLRQLIRAGTRLVVLAEEDGGTRPWYLPGFSFAQDTPLGAKTGAELRCRRFRGSADSPLLLINHWIDTFPPSPSRNAQIAGEFLERQLNRCEAARGLLPNLVAVDFHEQSDVVEIARGLNAERR